MGFGTPGKTIKDPDLVSSNAVGESQFIETDHYYKLQFRTLCGVWNSQISILRDSCTHLIALAKLIIFYVMVIASGADHLLHEQMVYIIPRF